MQLTYCATQVYESDRDRFLLSLFVPEPHRDSLLALYALNVELSRIRQQVSEEMIAHIRYAWWQEKIEALYAGQQTHGHPLLEALYPLIQAGHLPRGALLALVETYRAHYPEMPHDADARMGTLSLALLENICPQAETAWAKAQDIIHRHRRRYRGGYTGWLAARLLLAGMVLRKK